MMLMFITHNLGVIAEMADDVIVMYASQVAERGSVYDIFDAMAHPYTMGLFGSRPTAGARRGELKPIQGTVPPLNQYPNGCRFNPRCPYVMPKCLENAVPDFSLNRSVSHLVKCWLCENPEEESED